MSGITITAFCGSNDIDSEYLLKKITPAEPNFDYEAAYEELKSENKTLFERVDKLEQLVSRLLSDKENELDRRKKPSDSKNNHSDLENLEPTESKIEQLCKEADNYYNGNYTTRSYVKAFDLYREAAEAGNPHAQYMLGQCYRYGTGVLVDNTQAVKWYKQAAEEGIADAQYELGKCFHEGKGTAKDEHKAMSLYKRAAAQRNVKAQLTIGKCYLKGIGVKKNSADAKRWLKTAAANGSREAKQILSSL